jgi:ABC-2 type transport system permease protein
MKKALFIALKEVRDFLQDKGDLSFSLVLPIVIFALIYGAFGGSLQFNGTANIVNEDAGGKYSELLIQRLGDYKGVTVQKLSSAEADSKLERSNIQMAAFIPSGFSDKLTAGQPVQITFKQRGNGGSEGQIVANLIRGAADRIAQEMQINSQVQASLAGSNVSPQQIQVTVQKLIALEASSPTIDVNEAEMGSSPDPVNQFLPGIMTMFVLFAINLTAQALVEERRKGTLERLLATRLKVGELFAGKFLAYTARGFIQTTILLLLAYAVFRIFTPVSFLGSLLLALIFSAACSTLGLIIGSLCRSQNQANWIAVFFTMLMVMVSGTFMAIPAGTTLETLSHLSINTYANNAFRTLITEGGTLAGARTDILVMAGVAVVGLVLSRFLFRVSQEGK